RRSRYATYTASADAKTIIVVRTTADVEKRTTQTSTSGIDVLGRTMPLGLIAPGRWRPLRRRLDRSDRRPRTIACSGTIVSDCLAHDSLVTKQSSLIPMGRAARAAPLRRLLRLGSGR